MVGKVQCMVIGNPFICDGQGSQEAPLYMVIGNPFICGGPGSQKAPLYVVIGNHSI